MRCFFLFFFIINFGFAQNPYYIAPSNQTVSGNSGDVILASVIITRNGGPNNQPYYFYPSLCSGNSSDIVDMWIENGGVINNIGGYIRAEFRFRRNASATFSSGTYKFKLDQSQSCQSTLSTVEITVNYNPVCDLIAPMNFDSSNLTSTSVNLTWSNVSTATSYRIYYKLSTENVYSSYIDSNCCSSIINGLLPGKSYNLMIVPKCSNGLYSTNNKTISITTPCPTYNAPSNLSATPSGNGYTIGFTQIPNYTGYYMLDYINLSNNTSGYMTIYPGANFYYVSPPNSFSFKIRPVGSCFAPDSSWLTVNPNLCPSTSYPSSLSFSTQSICGSTPGRCCGYGQFSWSAVSGAVKYEVEYMGVNLTNTSVPTVSNTFQTTSINSVHPTLYACNSNQAGTWILKYRVRSQCSNGTWSDFSPWSSNFAW